MKTNFLAALTCLALAISSALGGPHLTDDALKKEILGYWSSPRHGYHFTSDGIIYMCPRKYATTKSRWDVRNGKFYWDGEPHSIVTLTNKKFVYRTTGGDATTFTLVKGTKEKVDPD